MRVLFTTFALPGHFFPLVPLAWGFRSAGHEVLVATSDEFVSTAVRSGLPVASCGKPGRFVDMVTAIPETHSVEQRRWMHGRAFGRIAAHSFARMT